jgi:hypothetical protein
LLSQGMEEAFSTVVHSLIQDVASPPEGEENTEKDEDKEVDGEAEEESQGLAELRTAKRMLLSDGRQSMVVVLDLIRRTEAQGWRAGALCDTEWAISKVSRLPDYPAVVTCESIVRACKGS